jgi:hypothetical protein
MTVIVSKVLVSHLQRSCHLCTAAYKNQSKSHCDRCQQKPARHNYVPKYTSYASISDFYCANFLSSDSTCSSARRRIVVSASTSDASRIAADSWSNSSFESKVLVHDDYAEAVAASVAMVKRSAKKAAAEEFCVQTFAPHQDPLSSHHHVYSMNIAYLLYVYM